MDDPAIARQVLVQSRFAIDPSKVLVSVDTWRVRS